MKLFSNHTVGLAAGLVLLIAMTPPLRAAHAVRDIDGVTGTEFTLTAKAGYVSTAEGNSVYFWGYALGDGPAQYPGPTLIVNQGDTVTVTLDNTLPVPVSIVFPGQTGVSAVGGVDGLITRQVPAAGNGNGSVTYTFTASQPGTYLYETGGPQADLQREMGLVGALIVRPTSYHPVNNRRAYNDPASDYDSSYEHEYLFLLTEMDEDIHDQVEFQVQNGQPVAVDMTKRFPVYWFINGRTGPDTVLPAFVPWLPHQPYDALTLIHAGDKILLRVIGAGSDSHPFHVHGNHTRVIARDGRLLSSAAPGSGADLAYWVFTIPSSPGSTYDTTFQWTGEKLGWDIYGHAPGDPLAPHEYAPDHGKPFPVKLPTDQDLTFGQMYSGSPFLGVQGTLPPGEGGFNPVGGFMYMWHSHAEKELCNNNIFGGGMLTFLLIAAHPDE